MSKFILELSKCDLEGSLADVITRLKELGDAYGYDKEIDIEIYTERDTFGESARISVDLSGNK